MPTSTSVRSRVRRRLEHSSWKSVCNEMAQAMRSKPANAPSKHLFDLPNEMLEMIIRQLDPPQLQPSALDSLQERTTERRAAHRSRDRKEVDGKTDTVLNSQRDWNAFAATCKEARSLLDGLGAIGSGFQQLIVHNPAAFFASILQPELKHKSISRLKGTLKGSKADTSWSSESPYDAYKGVTHIQFTGTEVFDENDTWPRVAMVDLGASRCVDLVALMLASELMASSSYNQGSSGHSRCASNKYVDGSEGARSGGTTNKRILPDLQEIRFRPDVSLRISPITEQKFIKKYSKECSGVVGPIGDSGPSLSHQLALLANLRSAKFVQHGSTCTSKHNPYISSPSGVGPMSFAWFSEDPSIGKGPMSGLNKTPPQTWHLLPTTSQVPAGALSRHPDLSWIPDLASNFSEGNAGPESLTVHLPVIEGWSSAQHDELLSQANRVARDLLQRNKADTETESGEVRFELKWLAKELSEDSAESD